MTSSALIRPTASRGLTGGGTYLRAALAGQPAAVYARIAPTFDELERHAHGNSERPLIEFYRRHNEIDLLVPVMWGTQPP